MTRIHPQGDRSIPESWSRMFISLLKHPDEKGQVEVGNKL